MREYLISLREAFAIATRAIRSQKMRSLLTTLGIIIGILSVTAMGTVVNGIEKGFENDIAELGTDVVYIEKWPWKQTRDWWNYINRPNITEELADIVESRSKYVVAATPVVMTSRTVASKQETLVSVTIQGTASDYLRVHKVDLDGGHFISEFDDRSASSVCVVGYTIAEKLFAFGNAVGKTIRIGGSKFLIVGITEKKGSGSGDTVSADRQVAIPYSTFQKLWGTRFRDISVQAKITDAALLDDAKDELTGILRTARGLDAKERDDFEINELESLRETIAPIKATIYSIGIGLTALSLLVGGIGVMNIMFVSVKERTKEIGIRKAVGAKPSNIMTQFLIEAVIVSMLGGVIGILLAIPISMLIQLILPASLDALVVFVAFGICVLIGTVFGLAPAWTAARAEPIEALRYE